MASQGSLIYGSDYNAVQLKVSGILGAGTVYGGPSPTPGPGPGFYQGGFGYNQTLASSSVAANQLITAAQWQNLANDINKAYRHQNNVDFAGYSTISGNITYSNLLTLDTIATNIYTNRFTVSNSQLTQTLIRTNTRVGSWGGGNTSITSQTNITWGSLNDMSYFFNQGGSFKFTGILPTGTTSQIISWRTLLTALNYTSTYVDFAAAYAVRDSSNYLIYTASGTTPYSANSLQIRMGIAGSTLSLIVRFLDGHVNPDSDSVSGGAGYNMYKNIASGAFAGTDYTSKTDTSSF